MCLILLPVGACLWANNALGDPGQTKPDCALGDCSILPAWHGEWKGKLVNLPLREEAPDVAVQLTIGVGEDENDGCLEWRTAYYVSDVPNKVKDYMMCLTDDGGFVLDEGGGVVLDVAIFGDIAYSIFSAQDVLLTSRYHLTKDTMVEEILFSPAEGQELDLDASIPVKIKNFPIKGVQRIELSRITPTKAPQLP